MSTEAKFEQAVSYLKRVFYNVSTVLADTWVEAFMYKPCQNMNPYVRWELLIIGSLFLGIDDSIDIQLHWLVLLPLLSAYLILTAITGFEPLYFLIQKIGAYFQKHWLVQKSQPVTRTHTVS